MKKALSLRGKITLFFAIISALLMLFLAGVAIYAFNSLTLETGRSHLLSIAETVRLHLTESMVDDTIDNRQRYFRRLEAANGLLSVRVVRSETINKEYNTPSDIVPTQAETEVLRDGKTIFSREVIHGESTMRAIVPYIANKGSADSPDCLRCHRTAKEGEVLGAIDITISTDEVESASQRIILIIVASILFFIFAAVGAIFLWLSPITRLSQEIQTAVGKAVSGDFDSTITGAGSDELGTIARHLNTLFTVLHEGLSQMCNQIVHLTYLSTKNESPNLLQDTMEKVNGLVEMYDFKQTIEDDPTSLDIYHRLIHVIKERFHITEGAIYEINSRRTHLSYIPFNEDNESSNLLCAPRIVNTPDNCRLFRTKRGVDSVKRPGVCTVFSQFVDPHEPPTKCHLCLPITTSSGIAACVQLVAPVENARQTRKNARFINIYLKELAPVLESKRLFEDLRRTSLHDPLTGLKNRRFLEEYTETITANLLRKNQYLTILMLDLDHFKQVNDTYGHDAGDIVLRHLAKTIKKILRASDLVIRMGGEEFLVLLLDTQIENGLRVAENIRKTLERSTIAINDKVTLQKTVSIGAAEFPNAENDFWLAVKQSDAALYEAKESGRNRVVRYTHNPDDFDAMSPLSNPPSLFPS